MKWIVIVVSALFFGIWFTPNKDIHGGDNSGLQMIYHREPVRTYGSMPTNYQGSLSTNVAIGACPLSQTCTATMPNVVSAASGGTGVIPMVQP